jgi:hypothetical protein
MPSTVFGKWAGWLLALFVALLSVFFGLVEAGQRGGETLFSNLALAIPMLGAATSAIVGGVLGTYALKQHDRSLVVIVTVLVGAFVLLWTATEILFPH